MVAPNLEAPSPPTAPLRRSPLLTTHHSLPHSLFANSAPPCFCGKPFCFILLRTLCRSRKSQPLWNQANPNSLCKTPGWGVSHNFRAEPLSPGHMHHVARLNSYALTRLRVLPVNTRVYPPRAFDFSTSGANRLDLCFHIPTNYFFRKPFEFTTIRIARGCHSVRPT